MNFTGTIISVRPSVNGGFPSVEYQAHHDHEMIGWAQWQTDIRGREPKVGDRARITSNGFLKIAF